MNKKIIISLSIVSVIIAIGIGATIAYFNDTETSTGNILTAGTLDLKVDHIKQTYNDVDCKTCGVTVMSDTSNYVVERSANAVAAWVHPAWTAVIPGAIWIWPDNPTKQEDTNNNVIYTFQKTFEWWGPITGATLNLGVGSDNSYEVWLNGTKIAGDVNENNFTPATQDTYSGVQISPYILQGQNTLEIKVKNWALANSTPYTNPAGLLYRLSIDGNCGDNYFKTHCQLWGLKDLADEKFFNFDDVKPGDRGVNVISLHVYNNDGWACLSIGDKVENENVVVDPEITAGDDPLSPIGELSKYLDLFVWRDDDGDGVYEPGAGETTVGIGNFSTITKLAVYDSTTGTGPLAASSNKNIGTYWCAGKITVDTNTGAVSCDGSVMLNDAQTDQLTASLTIYTEQWRNNQDFKCVPPTPLANGGFETDDFTSWNVNYPSLAQVVSSYTSQPYPAITYGPKEGTKFALLKSGAGNGVYTTISQDVFLNAGQKVEGWAAFDTTDYLPYTDDAMAQIIVTGVGTTYTAWEKDIPDVGSYGQSNWEYWSWTAPNTDTYTLELKVANQGDNAVDSYGLFDANVIIP